MADYRVSRIRLLLRWRSSGEEWVYQHGSSICLWFNHKALTPASASGCWVGGSKHSPVPQTSMEAFGGEWWVSESNKRVALMGFSLELTWNGLQKAVIGTRDRLVLSAWVWFYAVNCGILKINIRKKVHSVCICVTSNSVVFETVQIYQSFLNCAFLGHIRTQCYTSAIVHIPD